MSRLPLSMYCRRVNITVDGQLVFDGEKKQAEAVIERYAKHRNVVCVLPALEDGEHFYMQCNFKMEASDLDNYKFVDTLANICKHGVLPSIDRTHDVEAFLFVSAGDKSRLASESVHSRIRSKFEVVPPLE